MFVVDRLLKLDGSRSGSGSDGVLSTEISHDYLGNSDGLKVIDFYKQSRSVERCVGSYSDSSPQTVQMISW